MSFAAGFAVLWVFNALAAAVAFSASLAAGHVIAYAVTPYWMISTHSMMSMQSLTALFLLGRVEWVLALVIFIVFGWARLHLEAHTLMQYIMGGVVGVILTWDCHGLGGRILGIDFTSLPVFSSSPNPRSRAVLP